MRRILSACAVMALAGGLASGSAAAMPDAQVDQSAPPAPAIRDAPLTAAHTYDPPSIKWGECESTRLQNAGADCGFVTVPRDYNNHKGPKVKIAVSRIKANPDVRYQGAMLVNPGGPGGSGLGLSILGDFVPKNAGAGYDWIGFDPRGVGSSLPALSCDSKVTAPVRPYYSPTNSERLRAWFDRSRGYAADCAEKNGDMLPHLRSSNTVYDMDSIRKALGRWKLNLYGFSYGTYIGQLYATKYPSKVRRFVLDGVVNPGRAWYPANLDQNLAFDKTMDKWFDWVAENNDTYGLGATGTEVRKEWYSHRARLANWPRPGLGASEWTEVFLGAGYYVFGWDDMADIFVAASKGDYTLATQEYAAANPGTAGSDNGYAVYLGVQCTDAPWPKDWGVWSQDAWDSHKKAPFISWSNTWFNAPCKWWSQQGGTKPYMGSDKAGGMLLISETLDAATPFSGALSARQRFPKSALIEGVGGTTHSGSLSGVACVDDKVADYLLDGTLPKRVAGNASDAKCEPVPPPPATAPGAVGRQAPSTVKNQWLREALDEARPR